MFDLPNCTVSDYLWHVAPKSAQFKFHDFGNPNPHHGINLEENSSKENWTVILNAFRSPNDTSFIGVSCYAIFGSESEFLQFQEQSMHVRKLVKTFLSGIELKTNIPIEVKK